MNRLPRRLVSAARRGAVMEGRTDGGRALLGAGIVEQLCTTGAAAVNVHGLHLRGFEITGPLDLRGLTVAVPLHFADCAFTDPLLLDGTHLPSLSIMSSSLPGILANGLTMDRDLDLSASHVQGTHATTASTSKQAAIWLCESSIGGRLLCVDTVIHAPGQRAIQEPQQHAARSRDRDQEHAPARKAVLGRRNDLRNPVDGRRGPRQASRPAPSRQRVGC